MNSIVSIIAGVLFTVFISLMGLVLIPSWQVQEMQPIVIAGAEGEETQYPRQLTELESAGRLEYQSLGCIYCHTQQVRP